MYFDNECFVLLIQTVLDNLDLQLSREVEWRNQATYSDAAVARLGHSDIDAS